MLVASLEGLCFDIIIQYLNKYSINTYPNSSLIHQLASNKYEKFSQQIFKSIVENYPTVVTDDILNALCHGRADKISLKGCIKLTSNGLIRCLLNCDNVKVLDLCECDGLVHTDLPAILKEYAPQLKNIILDNCTTLTNEILRNLFHIGIEDISCEGCHELQDGSLPSNYANNLVTTTGFLTTINVSSCHSVSSTFIRYLTAVHGPTLKSVNISWTSIDCLALVYLAGYTISTKASLTLKNYVSIKDLTCRNNLSRLFSFVNDMDNVSTTSVFTEEMMFKRPIEKSASGYLKDLCAYCTQDICMRQPSGSHFSSIMDSYEDYDIIDSQLVHILEDDNTLTSDVEDIYADWAILSINDLYRVERPHCTCSSNCTQSHSAATTDEASHSNTDEESTDSDPQSFDSSFDFQRVYQPQITSLDITRIDFFDNEIGIKCLEFFIHANTSLVQFYTSWTDLSNEMLAEIAQHENDLELVSLVDCEHINNEGIFDLVKNCKKIKAIDFKGLPFVWDQAFLQLISTNNELQYMSLAESSISDVVLFKIALTLKTTLRHLDLSWCDNITDKGVVTLLEACGDKLIYFDLRQCNVAEDTIKAISMHANNLQMIGLCGIKGLNDTTCIPLFKSLPNLRVIDLSWNSSLNDSALITLFESCKHLREVTIAGLKRISSKAFLPIIPNYQQWQEVRCEIRNNLYRTVLGYKKRHKDVTDMENLDRSFYLPFRSITYASELRKLTLGYCAKVNDTHLGELVAVCRGTLTIEDYYGEIIKPLWSYRV